MSIKIAPYVSMKNSLKMKSDLNDIIKQIIERVREIDGYESLNMDLELLTFVCNIIENELVNKKGKAKHDKKQICIEIYKKLFSGQINEKQIEANIEYLHENKKFVKVSICKFICVGLYQWILKKFL